MNGKSVTQFVKVAVNNNSLSKRKLVFGKGINDSWYKTKFMADGVTIQSPAHNAWRDMLRRSYDPKYHEREPSYSDVTVCEEWLLFSNFDGWYQKEYIEGYQLDKDIKVKGNKEYGPSACLYIPRCINSLLNRNDKVKGKYPTGVSIRKRTGRFETSICIDNKRVFIASKGTAEEAYHEYKKAKNKEILRKCKQYPEYAVYLKQHIYAIEG